MSTSAPVPLSRDQSHEPPVIHTVAAKRRHRSRSQVSFSTDRGSFSYVFFLAVMFPSSYFDPLHIQEGAAKYGKLGWPSFGTIPLFCCLIENQVPTSALSAFEVYLRSFP